MAALRKGPLESGDWICWSAYHAHTQQAVIPPAALNTLLPLFLDNAHSVAIIKHSMDVINAAVRHLNPAQVTVIAADHPLYATAKQIPWTWSSTHGEDSFVIMFGGLHIEMAVLKANAFLFCLTANGKLARRQRMDTCFDPSQHCKLRHSRHVHFSKPCDENTPCSPGDSRKSALLDPPGIR